MLMLRGAIMIADFFSIHVDILIELDKTLFYNSRF